MKFFNKKTSLVIFIFVFFLLAFHIPLSAFAAKKKQVDEPAKASTKFNDAFNIKYLSDMSDFDPENPVIPTGDTIKIAIVSSFSGPGAVSGAYFFGVVQWVAHDINKRGGILVDGKKKLIQVIKADHMGRTDQCQKICKRMIIQEGAHVLWGTDGAHLMKIMQQAGQEHKVIVVNATVTSDELMNADNFNPYTFYLASSTRQTCYGLAYFYGKLRKKEKKFYLLNPAFGAGYIYTDMFKKGLQKYYPEAEIVGEDHHKLFLTDFAPYLTKIKASGAEVVLTSSFTPDAANLAKQAKEMELNVKFGHVWMDAPDWLNNLGLDGANGWAHVGPYFAPTPIQSVPEFTKIHDAWIAQWKTWKNPPWNGRSFAHATAGTGGAWMNETYWLMSVIERAKTTNANEIIKVWENDIYKGFNGEIWRMRACDHKVIRDLSVEVYVPPAEQKQSFTTPPYYWYNNCSFVGPIYRISANIIPPWMDDKLNRCAGKSEY